MNNDGPGAGRSSRKPRLVRRVERFGTRGLEYPMVYKYFVTYGGFGAGVSVPGASVTTAR